MDGRMDEWMDGTILFVVFTDPVTLAHPTRFAQSLLLLLLLCLDDDVITVYVSVCQYVSYRFISTGVKPATNKRRNVAKKERKMRSYVCIFSPSFSLAVCLLAALTAEGKRKNRVYRSLKNIFI